MLISIIVAMANNRVIGRDGRMPWHLPSDLHRFRSLTMGQVLIMGRRTYASIGEALPGRRTIVISRNPAFTEDNCEVAASLKEALALADGAAEVFVCGGEEVYRHAMPLVDRIYLTQLADDFSGDTVFPDFPCDEFDRIYTKVCSDTIDYRFSVWQRYRCPAPFHHDPDQL